MTDAAEAPPSRRARLFLYLGLAIVALAVGIGLWLAARPVRVPVQGEVEAETVDVATKALARVDRLLAAEGDRVAPGQLLATLSSPEIVNGAQQAQAVLDGAHATQSLSVEGARAEDVASVRATWLATRATADLAATSAVRADRLFAQGVIAEQRRDEAHAARDATARTAEAAHAQYRKALTGTRPQTRAIADAQVRVAAASVATAAALRGETRLIAPIAGEIARRLLRPGEIVSPVLPAYQIVDIDHPYVLINVREDDYAGLETGRVLNGDIPALGRSARFRVRHISPQGAFATSRAVRQTSGYDVRAFEVRLDPVAPVRGLRPGMSVLFDWPR